MLRKRRRWKLPGPDRPAGEAQRAVRDAVRDLDTVLARQSEVDEVSAPLARAERENRLVPKLRLVLGAHSE